MLFSPWSRCHSSSRGTNRPNAHHHSVVQRAVDFFKGSSYKFAPIILVLKSPLFGHEAKRKIRIFCVSCRSAMKFARESLFAGPRLSHPLIF